MGARSTDERYGAVAVALHWVSALFVLVLLAAGYLMPELEGGMKTMVYRGHVVLGGLVLLLTLVRIAWRRFDEKPASPPGIDGTHKLGFEAVHVLLYVGLLGAAASGVALSLQSGLGESLFFGSGSIPSNLWDYRSRMAHRVFSWSVAVLTFGHIGGVVLHQLTKSDVMSRMGVPGVPSGDGQAPGLTTKVDCRDAPVEQLLRYSGLQLWKPSILHYLADEPCRFNELKRRIPGISQRMLTLQLRELEKDGLVIREHYPEIPPRVEYSISPLGRTLRPIYRAIKVWEETHSAAVEKSRREYAAR